MTTPTNWLAAYVQPHVSLLPPLELPRRYAEAKLDEIPYPALVKALKKYGDAFWTAAPKGIAPFFVGAAGTYKSYSAALLASSIREVYRIPVGWCNCAAELVQLDRRQFDKASEARIDFLKSVPFLVMDDFTQVKQGSRQLDIMIEIGTERFDQLLPTLWTGNISLSKDNTKELDDAVGACLSRRMLETSEGFRVVVKKKL